MYLLLISYNKCTTPMQDVNQKETLEWESITKNKASGGDGIPVELFQILKDAAVKVLHSIFQHIWKTLHWPQHWKSLCGGNPTSEILSATIICSQQ